MIPPCEDCILHLDCKDCASPFSFDYRIPKSLSREVSKRQRRQKIGWNLSSVGSHKKVRGRVFFLVFGPCSPFYMAPHRFGSSCRWTIVNYPSTDRQNTFWEAVPDFPCGNATLPLQDIFISILSNHNCRYSSQVYLDDLWCFDLVSLFHLGFPVPGEQKKAPLPRFQDGLAWDKDPVKEIQGFFSDALRQRFNVLP